MKKEINTILYYKTIPLAEIQKIYQKIIDIIKTQFEIIELENIERRDNIDTISGKVGDFMSDMIKKLIQEGYEATWKKLSSIYSTTAIIKLTNIDHLIVNYKL